MGGDRRRTVPTADKEFLGEEVFMNLCGMLGACVERKTISFLHFFLETVIW